VLKKYVTFCENVLSAIQEHANCTNAKSRMVSFLEEDTGAIHDRSPEQASALSGIKKQVAAAVDCLPPFPFLLVERQRRLMFSPLDS